MNCFEIRPIKVCDGKLRIYLIGHFLHNFIESTDEEEILHEFVKDLPYGKRTVFGIVTLLDPRRHIRDAVFKEKCGIPCMGLDEGEKLAMQYLIKGRYFANTGTYLHMCKYT
jgi:hypothetical protein